MVIDWVVYAALALAAASAASSIIQQRKQKKAAEKAATEAAAVQLSGHDSNRGLYVVYGKALIGSTVVWKGVTNRQVYPATPAGFTKLSNETGGVTQNGTRGRRNLYRAVSLCEGPVEAIENVTIDGTGYDDDKFTKRNNLHWDCYAHTGDGANNYFSEWASAGDSQANPGVLSQWDSTKHASYIAMAYENCYLDGKSPAFQGEPQTKYLVKGRKVYDPRLDSTVPGGVGSHRHTDDSTWAYSSNPALCVLDYLTASRYGKGIDIADVEISTFMSAADACEEQVTIPAKLTNTTGSTQEYYDPFWGIRVSIANLSTISTYRPEQTSTTIDRFSMNIALDPTKNVLDNLNEMLNCFKANLLYVNGTYRLHMDGVESSVMSITDDDIIGSINITQGSREDRMNHLKLTFVNANKQHKEDTVAWPKLDSSTYSTYLAEDNNEELHEEISINGITDSYQAEDLAEFLVRDSRNNLTLNLGLGPRFAALIPGDVVDVTTDAGNYVAKYFRVQQVVIDPDTLNVKATLREYDSSVYTWDSSKGNEPLGYTFDAGSFNDVLPAVSGLVATGSINTEADGSTTNVIDVQWTEIQDTEVSALEVLWSSQGNNYWNSVMVTDPDTQTEVQLQVPYANQIYDITVRYRALVNDGSGERTSISANASTTATVGTLTGSALDSIEAGATNGATWGVDITDQPADSELTNSSTTWDQVSANGGSTIPADNATVGALGGEVAVINPGFEDGLNGWGSAAGWGDVVSTGSVLLGSNMFRCYESGGVTRLLGNDSYNPTEAGAKWLAGGFIRRNSSWSGTQADIRIHWYDESSSFISSSTIGHIDGADAADTWHPIFGQLVAPASTAFARIFCRIVGMTAGECYFDQLTMGRMPLDSYIDITGVTDALAYSGGGTYLGDLSATLGATWGTDISGQPADTDILNERVNPYGVLRTYNTASTDVFRYNVDEDYGILKDFAGSEAGIGMAFPPFRVNEDTLEETYHISVPVRSDVSNTDGLYVRVYEYNSDLPAGKLAISQNASQGDSRVQEHSQKGTISPTHENASTGTTWEHKTFTYTPTAGAAWASIVCLNWTDMSNNELHFRQPIIRTDTIIPQSLTSDRAEIAFVSLDNGTSYTPSVATSANLTAHPSGDTGTFTVNVAAGGSMGSASISSGFTKDVDTSGYSYRLVTITHTASGATCQIECRKDSADVTGGGGKTGTLW
jgi:hypothetical protein